MRKLRFGDSKRGKGTRGGVRIIYYWHRPEDQFWLFTLYGKDEADDLTPDQKKALRKMVKSELEAR